MIPLPAYSASFSTDFQTNGGLNLAYKKDGFAAELSYTGYGLDVYTTEIGDQTLRAINDANLNKGTFTLSFNNPVDLIQFDFGGIDFADSATFDYKPNATINDAKNLSQFFGTNDLQIVPTIEGKFRVEQASTNNNEGGRLTFRNLGGITKFSWINTGLWTFYDNFRFVTLEDNTQTTPESSTSINDINNNNNIQSIPESRTILGFLGIGGLMVATRREQKK